MIKKISAVILLCYYLSSQVMLPEGNFTYLEQLPDLYRDYIQLNGDTNAADFIEEEFFDYERVFGTAAGDEDDPFEKESKPVPFHAVSFNMWSVCTPCEAGSLNPPPGDKGTLIMFYLLGVSVGELSPIFHPPNFVVV